MPSRPSDTTSTATPNRKLIKISQRSRQTTASKDKKITGGALQKPKRTKKKEVPAKSDKETQTLPCKGTQTHDELLQSREEQFFQLLKERKAANESGSNNDDGTFVQLDVRIPELTIQDLYAYAERHNCEIRMS
ncbi:uncharacterized protein LOC129586246 isoform X2 [Paramacrobiotus metropolitanus]|uniref:uncharacterized protein LOC129586246 isoform X2 n=1 Tax=Paramacrobiotus metropolitanus TaxID=2943436 RepID=UPI002445E28A|nr:uncharacterized protein LOC129586246 isoform X2 [Paramacrobiotus metropolitanus]